MWQMKSIIWIVCSSLAVFKGYFKMIYWQDKIGVNLLLKFHETLSTVSNRTGTSDCTKDL